MSSPAKTLPTQEVWKIGRRIRNLTKLLMNSGASSPYKVNNENYLQTLKGYWLSNERVSRRQHIDEALVRLSVAIENRKVTEGRKELSALRLWLAEYDHGFKMTLRVAAHIQLNDDLVGYAYDAETGMNLAFKELCEEIRQLAQGLPTQPELPSTYDKDLVIRGIIAILRTHKIAGVELLTENGEANANELKEAESGSPQHDQIYDDEEDDEYESEPDETEATPVEPSPANSVYSPISTTGNNTVVQTIDSATDPGF